MSFKLAINPRDQAAGRFIGSVRHALAEAVQNAKSKHGIAQSDIAQKLEIHRSVINRILKGDTNLTLRSLAEIAWALDLQPVLELRPLNTQTAIHPPSIPNFSGTVFDAPLNSLADKNDFALRIHDEKE